MNFCCNVFSRFLIFKGFGGSSGGGFGSNDRVTSGGGFGGSTGGGFGQVKLMIKRFHY